MRITAKKEAVAQRNIVKHEKDLDVTNSEEWCGFDADKDSELELHHEFNYNAARRNNIRVDKLLISMETLFVSLPTCEMSVVAQALQIMLSKTFLVPYKSVRQVTKSTDKEG